MKNQKANLTKTVRDTSLNLDFPVLYEVVAGSHAYGTNTPESDSDLRGIYFVPPIHYAMLRQPLDQVGDDKHDIVYYNLRRIFELMMTANPNIIELLWIPQDCVREYYAPAMDILMANRHLFLTKRTYKSHAQYAKTQIGKAKGKNKRVNNPCPKDPPRKQDFCWFIDCVHFADIHSTYDKEGPKVFQRLLENNVMPCRPESIGQPHLDGVLKTCHAAKLERIDGVYRIYLYGDDAKGVFRGPYEQLVLESIPIEDEWTRFVGLLIYNEQAYNKALKEWKEYWEWMKKRNPARWKDQECGKTSYDSKNMMHCVRLYMSCINIFENGAPKVRFEGEERDLLMKIRQGTLSYKEIMELVGELSTKMKVLCEKSLFPEEVDVGAAENLLIEISNVM